jgi:hypothetical protein
MALIANWGTVRSERNVLSIKVLCPSIESNETPEKSTPRPLPEFPTDVPAPEPHDVPVPDPIDPPPRDPGKTPKPSKPEPEHKPRSVP